MCTKLIGGGRGGSKNRILGNYLNNGTMVTSYKYHRLIMLFALVLSTTRSERISFVTYKVCANTAQYVFLNCHSCSCRLRQGGIFSVMLIRSTAHPSYCPFAILPIRHTATSDLRRVPIRPIEKCPSDLRKMPIRSLLTCPSDSI